MRRIFLKKNVSLFTLTTTINKNKQTFSYFYFSLVCEVIISISNTIKQSTLCLVE